MREALAICALLLVVMAVVGLAMLLLAERVATMVA